MLVVIKLYKGGNLETTILVLKGGDLLLKCQVTLSKEVRIDVTTAATLWPTTFKKAEFIAQM